MYMYVCLIKCRNLCCSTTTPVTLIIVILPFIFNVYWHMYTKLKYNKLYLYIPTAYNYCTDPVTAVQRNKSLPSEEDVETLSECDVTVRGI